MTSKFVDSLRPKYQQTYDKLGRDLAAEMKGIKPIIRKKRTITPKNQFSMSKLVELVGSNGKQDIKKINKMQSVNGAREWIKKYGYEDIYSADHEDVDNDGIQEVVVKDKDGKYVIINGYTLRPSDFPYREKYYELDEAERKKYNGYKDYFRRGYYQPEYDKRTGEISGWGINPEEDQFTQDMINHMYEYKSKLPKKKLSPYQLFISTYVRNMYDYVIDFYQLRTADDKKPNIFIPLATKIWNEWVIDPILKIIFKDDKNPLKIKEDPKEFNKLKSKSVFKDLILEILYNYFSHSDRTNEDLLRNIHDIALELVEEWYEETGAEKGPNYGQENDKAELKEVVPVTPSKPNNEETQAKNKVEDDLDYI